MISNLETISQFILDALPSHVAVVDETGTIIATNAAWRTFVGNESLCEGGNYLYFCDNLQGNHAIVAQYIASGVRAVLLGEQETFASEYPMNGIGLNEWYTLRVRPIFYNGQRHALVMRENITERKLSAQMTRELNQELETTIRDLFAVYDVGRSLASTLDPQKIYRILYNEVTRRMPDLQHVRIDLYDEESRVVRCAFAGGQDGELDCGEFAPYHITSELLAEAVRSRHMLLKSGSKAILHAPLIAGDRVIGILTLEDDNPNVFAQADLQVIESVTSQAAFALQNAQLYTTIHLHAAELNALYNATSFLTKADNLAQLGQEIVKAVTLEFAQADCGLILVDNENRQVRRLARTGEYHVRIHQPISLDRPSLVTEAVRTESIVYAPDVSRHPLYLANDSRTRSELVIPLYTQRGMVAVLDLQSEKLDAFSEQDQRVLAAFAERSAHAIENMQLQERVRSYAEELEKRVDERTRQLTRAKDHVESILNSSPAALVMVKNDGRVQQINPAFSQSFDYVDDEAFRMPLSLCVQPPEVFTEALNNAIEEHQPQRLEVLGVRKDGTTFAADLMIAPINKNDPTSLICSFRDISERKAMEENLRQALEKEKELNELKSRFVSMVSHEFRTPLATIQSSTDIIKHYADRMTPERRNEHLEKVQAQVMRLTDMMEDILTMSRAETVGLELRTAPTEFETFCRGIAAEMQTLSPRHTVSFGSTGQARLLTIDPKLMRQALMNLLHNAVKYSAQKTTVRLHVQFADDGVQVSVTDEGIGIPEEDQRHLFEAFHRATNVGNTPGTGIGLVIVKQVVDLHGGSLSVTSQINIGTTFTVHLPN